MSRGLAALGDRDFRWFFLARAIVLVAGSMSSIALAFAVLEIDNHAGSLSLVLATMVVSNIAFVLLGGIVADRFPRAVVIQTCYVVDALSLATTAALLFTHTATIPLLCVLAAVNGASSAFAMPAMQGIIPQLTTPEHLQQADAMLSFVQSAVTVGGPAVAGVLVATAGPAWAMVVEAVGVAAAIPILARVTLPPPTRGADRGASMLSDLRTGWREVRSRSWLWTIVLAFTVLNAIQGGAWGVGGPYIAKNDPLLGIAGWGWVVSAQGVGVLAMTLVLMRVPLRRPLRHGMIGIAAMGLPLAALGVYPAVLPLAVVAVISGIGEQVFSTGWNLAMMENVPVDRLSRVSSYDMLGSFIAMPIGTLAYGWLITHVAVGPLLVVSATVYAVVALAVLAVPGVWRMGRAAGQPVPPVHRSGTPDRPAPDVPS